MVSASPDIFIVVLKYGLFLILLNLWLLLFPHLKSKIKKPSSNSSTAHPFLFIFAYLIGFLSLFYRYWILPIPQGFDVPFYIFQMKAGNLSPFTSPWHFGRFLSLLILLFFYYVTRDFFLLFIIIPVFFGGIFILGIYILSSQCFDTKTGIYTSILFSFSFIYFRLYLDLIANLIAWSFVPYAFYVLSKLKYTQKYVSKYHITLLLLMFIIFFSHLWSAILFLVIVLLDSLFVLYHDYRQFIRSYILIYVTLACFSSIIYILYPQIIIYLLGLFQRNPPIVSPFIGLNNPFQLIDRENFMVLFLAVFGAHYLARNFNLRNSIVFSWYALISFLILISIFFQPFRLLVLFPMGILAGLGLRTLESSRVFTRLNIRGINLVSTIIIFLIVFTSLFPSPITYKYYRGSYLADHVLTPSTEALDQLLRINSLFGWNNSSILFLIGKEVKPINNLGYSNYYYWAAALLGENYFSGLLFDAMQGLPRKKLGSWDSEMYYEGYEKAPPLNNETIIFASEWYPLTRLELSVSKEIAPNIYVLLTTNVSEVFTIAKSLAYAYSSNFSKGFNIIADWKNYLWSYNLYNGFSFDFSPLKTEKWLKLEFDLLNILGIYQGAKYFMFNISAFLPFNTTIILQLLSTDHVLEEFDLSYLVNYSFKPLILQFNLPSNSTIRFVRFCIKVSSNTATNEWFHIQLNDFLLL